MNFVTSISLVVLGAMFLALLGWGSIRAAWRNCEGRRGVFAALAILAAVCSIVAQKPSPDRPTITVDALLRDVGCYATNDVFHAAVTNAPSYAGVDFSECDLMVYARERASSDAASWFELTPRKKFSQQPADYAIENATNYNYMVYLNYVPPSPVHTNGVFELYGFVIENETQGEPDQLAAGFINSRTLLPPPTARDYVQDGLVAIWDCVENSGWGDGDISETGWTELVSGKVTQTAGRGTFSATAFKMSAANKLELVSNNFRTLTARTVEVVFSDSYGSVGNRVYVEDNNANAGFSLQSNTSNCRLTCNLGNTHQNEVPYSEIARAAPLFCHWALSQSNTSTLYVNGGERRKANKSFTPFTFTSIGLGLRTNIQADYCCVRVYSRALSADEIRHNYKVDKERFNLP